MKKEMLRRLEALETKKFGSPRIARFLALLHANRLKEADRLAHRMRIDPEQFTLTQLDLLKDVCEKATGTALRNGTKP